MSDLLFISRLLSRFPLLIRLYLISTQTVKPQCGVLLNFDQLRSAIIHVQVGGLSQCGHRQLPPKKLVLHTPISIVAAFGAISLSLRI